MKRSEWIHIPPPRRTARLPPGLDLELESNRARAVIWKLGIAILALSIAYFSSRPH